MKITYLSSRVDIDHELPASPGVYEISLGLGRAYIGSTGNLKNRVRQHFAQLNDLIHQNKPLQEDFRRTGPEQFTFTVVKHSENSSQALLLEEQEIGANCRRHDAVQQNARWRGATDNSGSMITISDIADPSSLSHANRQSTPGSNVESSVSPPLPVEDALEADVVAGAGEGHGNQARLEAPNGDRYVGNMLGITKHGFADTNGSTAMLEGDWLDGELTGIGTCTWADGEVYEGDFVEGQLTERAQKPTTAVMSTREIG